MFFIDGKYNRAKVFIDELDSSAISQIIELCNQPFTKGCKIRIMPDAHKGAGCTIGFTADLGNKVVPNLTGVDLGCGMLTIELGHQDIDLQVLDEVINSKVPSGYHAHENVVKKFDKIKKLHCYDEIKKHGLYERQIGTLGGGNHFIELDKDDDGNLYLVLHSGSRNLGKMVADYYQDMAIDDCKNKDEYLKDREALIQRLKDRGEAQRIQSELKKFDKIFAHKKPDYPDALCFLEGDHRQLYLDDMAIAQKYASLNRETMANIILSNMFDKDIGSFSHFETVHNYINLQDNIIRKGAVSAYKDERFIVPINMRDGSLICVGKGNEDWNFSAPHGAGRLMSRSQAKREIDLNDFTETMQGVYSSSVGQSTLDEAPQAYKSIDSIIANIGGTATIERIIKPVYNFKAN